jgi:hypothetical protein
MSNNLFLFGEIVMRRVLFVLFFLSTITCISFGAPEPAVVQGPGLWTLNTEFTNPQPIIMYRNEDNKPIRYWYIIITLTNNSNNNASFYPGCDIMTDLFEIISAGKNVPTVVWNQIKQRHQKKYPFLELLGKTDNTILQGQDNTKDIAIIWPDLNAKASKISIFISGLSNETAVVDHPILKDKDGSAEKVYLRKTLELDYALKGDLAAGTDMNLSYISKSWIMR